MKTTKLIVAMSLLAASSSAVAFENDPRPRLRKLFETGDQPKLTELRSIWVGRCYYQREDIQSTEGAILIGKENTDRDGPLFEDSNRVRVNVHTDDNPERFDNFKVKDYLSGGDGGVYFYDSDDHYSSTPKVSAYLKDGAVEQSLGNCDCRVYSDEPRVPTYTAWRFRKNGKYLVAQRVKYFDVYSLKTKGAPFRTYKERDKKLRTETEVQQLCYFFDKLN